ncbi:MAG: hypothetical protein HYV27_14915 [Candidatus Hydrogenedentes bacterium]|nr:hypothetical protein [Candidatus Hydrogenedentota bacterium]
MTAIRIGGAISGAWRYCSSRPAFIHLFFFLYLLFCLMYYKERTVNHDSGTVLLDLCTRGEDFVPPSDRKIYYLTFALAMLGIKWHFPLVLVCLLHSINLWLLQYVIAGVLIHVFRRLDLAWLACLLVLCHMINGTYLPHGEIYTGTFISLLLIAMGASQPSAKRTHRAACAAGFLLMGALVAEAHPVFVLSGVFIPLYLYLTAARPPLACAISIFLGAAAGFAVKFFVTISPYESGHLNNLTRSGSLGDRLLLFVQDDFSVIRFLIIFNSLLIGIALSVLLTASKKQRMVVALSAVFAVGMLLISVLRFGMNEVDRPYLWYSTFAAFFFALLPLLDARVTKRRAHRVLLPVYVSWVLLNAAFGTWLSVAESRREERRMLAVLASAKEPATAYVIKQTPVNKVAFKKWNIVTKSLMVTTLAYGRSGTQCLAYRNDRVLLKFALAASDTYYFGAKSFTSIEELPLLVFDLRNL